MRVVPLQVIEMESGAKSGIDRAARSGMAGDGVAVLEVEWDLHCEQVNQSGRGPGQRRGGVTVFADEPGSEVNRVVFWAFDAVSGPRRTLATFGLGARFEERRDTAGAIRSLDVWCDGPVLRLSVLGKGAVGGVVWARSRLPELLGLVGGQYHVRGIRVFDADIPRAVAPRRATA